MCEVWNCWFWLICFVATIEKQTWKSRTETRLLRLCGDDRGWVGGSNSHRSLHFCHFVGQPASLTPSLTDAPVGSSRDSPCPCSNLGKRGSEHNLPVKLSRIRQNHCWSFDSSHSETWWKDLHQADLQDPPLPRRLGLTWECGAMTFVAVQMSRNHVQNCSSALSWFYFPSTFPDIWFPGLALMAFGRWLLGVDLMGSGWVLSFTVLSYKEIQMVNGTACTDHIPWLSVALWSIWLNQTQRS